MMSGSKSIGESEWKPHNCNVETNPYAISVGGESFKEPALLRKCSEGDIFLDVKKYPVKYPDKLSSDSVLVDEKHPGKILDPSCYEWTYYTDGSKHGKKCAFEVFDNKGVPNERKLEGVIGRHRKVKDSRGGIPCITPGDKNYAVPEFSSDFHKEGSTLPAVNFSRSSHSVTDTFIPLQRLSSKPSVTYLEKEKVRKLDVEKEEVAQLDAWHPAEPITAGFNIT